MNAIFFFFWHGTAEAILDAFYVESTDAPSPAPTARPAVSHSMRNTCVWSQAKGRVTRGCMCAAAAALTRILPSKCVLLSTCWNLSLHLPRRVGAPTTRPLRRIGSPAVHEQSRPRRRAADWVEEERLDELELMLRQVAHRPCERGAKRPVPRVVSGHE